MAARRTLIVGSILRELKSQRLIPRSMSALRRANLDDCARDRSKPPDVVPQGRVSGKGFGSGRANSSSAFSDDASRRDSGCARRRPCPRRGSW